jgi:hypothetical protein
MSRLRATWDWLCFRHSVPDASDLSACDYLLCSDSKLALFGAFCGVATSSGWLCPPPSPCPGRSPADVPLVGQDSNLVVRRIPYDTLGILFHALTQCQRWHRLAAFTFMAATQVQLAQANHHVALATCHPPYPTPSSATRNWVRLACVCHPVGFESGRGQPLSATQGKREATFALVTTVGPQPRPARSTPGEPGRAADRQAFASRSYPTNRQALREPHVGRPGFLESMSIHPRTAVRRG